MLLSEVMVAAHIVLICIVGVRWRVEIVIGKVVTPCDIRRGIKLDDSRTTGSIGPWELYCLGTAGGWHRLRFREELMDRKHSVELRAVEEKSPRSMMSRLGTLEI